jgi:DNA-binding PucR family transcriptional regulator
MNPNIRKAMQELVVILQTTHLTLPEVLREFKKEWLEQELWQNGGNYCRTAKSLGTHRNTLSRNARLLGIDVTTIRKASGREREASRMTGAA